MTLTPDDIRNPRRRSGFNYIAVSVGDGTRGVRFQAEVYGGRIVRRKSRPTWRGPARRTPEEAAQDYCNYINDNPSVPRSEPLLKSAGHSGSRPLEAIPSDIEAAYGMIRDFKAQQAGKQGYVYLIIEEGFGAGFYGKIGFSTNPQARVRELQTGNPRVLKLYATKLGTLEDERALHKRYRSDNVLAEWFRLSPSLIDSFTK